MYPIPISETAKPYESYVPRSSRTFLFECLQYAKTEGEGLVHCIYLGIQRLMGGCLTDTTSLRSFLVASIQALEFWTFPKWKLIDCSLIRTNTWNTFFQSGTPVYLDVIHMIKAGLPSLFSHIGKWSKKKEGEWEGLGMRLHCVWCTIVWEWSYSLS